ncbi:uncharacterized protein EV420DRAFT_1475316 [Desarmillaria tabescens]|uniref:Altered inheritance of mitochondria protein 6 n=1 Tax=Armillaria tabescens TaxID=1929756 RepID=A0AA39TNH4_ARMTA|nr:uncharacterized protein EV420DRAFT_1475316 [Desarmillaria tabescens]KAK0465087.1 hypothetical protein EV420DRAFT_1475316 [Desarmillaria tabescens]
MMILLTVILCFFAPYVSPRAGVNDQIAFLQSSNSTLLQYPTQFTQGIIPKAIHSHNDYWRDVPLLTALSLGVASVEADVWLVNKTLYVGHEEAALTKDRTLDSLYIRPLLSILDLQNPSTDFQVNEGRPNWHHASGVFDTSSSTALQLFIDIKTDGTDIVRALPVILETLAPLRRKGYLTTFSNGTLIKSAVTVIGTGNTLLDGVLALSPRDYFFDAPLAELSTTETLWNDTISPVASTDYEVAVGWNGIGNITEAQLANLTQFVNDAHERGITARYWDTPGWPILVRNNVWKELLNAGADWLNADDLEAAILKRHFKPVPDQPACHIAVSSVELVLTPVGRAGCTLARLGARLPGFPPRFLFSPSLLLARANLGSRGSPELLYS